MLHDVNLIAAEQRARATVDPETAKRGVYDVIARASPHLDSPTHLAPFVDACSRAPWEPMRLGFSAPPQHGKSTVSMHAIVYWCLVRPDLSHAYATYNFDRAVEMQREVERIAFDMGMQPSGKHGIITMGNGAVVRFAGCGGGGRLTGRPISGGLVIDDPIKDRVEAESKLQRERAWGWWLSVAKTRMHPGSWAIAMMTRWHTDDMLGRLVSIEGWRYLRMPAIADDDDDPCGRPIGAALWPSKRPLAWLGQFQDDAYTWAAMYQGSPRPRGDSLFTEPAYYDRLPDGYRVCYGVDLAYSEKTRADYSVLVEGRVADGKVYIADVKRMQVQAPEFTRVMAQAVKVRRGPALWLCSGTEKGTAQLIQRSVGTFRYKVVTQDKYARALPCAEKFWNQGKWLLPAQGARWADDYYDEHLGFTGQQDAHDDQVDASAALSYIAQVSLAGGSSEANRALRAAQG